MAGYLAQYRDLLPESLDFWSRLGRERLGAPIFLGRAQVAGGGLRFSSSGRGVIEARRVF
jgi:hypothetical protein